MTVKLSDYIVQRFREWGVDQVFMVTGGGAMHLNDSIGRPGGVPFLCTHHEQGATIAAEGYARISSRPGVACVTTGPGGINALNGVFGCWTDSIPLLVLSGQVKRETCMATYPSARLRQLGDQEVDIIRMVSGITKYAVLIDDPASIAYHLERAWHLCNSGRPGPCWLDIPVDVQSAQIDESSLEHYTPDEDQVADDSSRVTLICAQVIERIRRSERPVILAGSGVRLAGALEEFERVIRLLRVPVTTAWTHDLIASDDEVFCGRPGTIGDRAGNFCVQNSDLLLVLGSRLNIRQVSYNWHAFATHAYRIQVDVDGEELRKPTVRPDLPVHCDLKDFLHEMARLLEEEKSAGWANKHEPWLKWCRERRQLYPVVQAHHRSSQSPLNPYHFVDRLFDLLGSDDAVVCGNATACIVPFQAARLKAGQRMFSNSGAASMGHDLPASIGAAAARGGKRVVCLAGEGSIQLNIQELQTVVHHQLPVKIFVLNNGGYLSIRLTQSGFFGNLVGAGPSSGVSFPDMVKIALAYGIPARHLSSELDMAGVAAELDAPGPFLWEVHLDPEQEFEPRSKSRQLPDGRMFTPPLEDMYPFLSPEELKSNILVPEP